MINRLNEAERRAIEDLQHSAPVHVVPIAQHFGVPVLKNDSFPNDLSGLIKKSAGGTYEIHVNANHPITRQRFTMAHELAHFLLHRDKIGDGVADDYLYRSGLSNVTEREANDLAAELLMPKHLLETNNYRDRPTDVLASEFWVSPVSMDIRLGRLS